jgi:hypothetical protein
MSQYAILMKDLTLARERLSHLGVIAERMGRQLAVANISLLCISNEDGRAGELAKKTLDEINLISREAE